jgi:hypothetical protein
VTARVVLDGLTLLVELTDLLELDEDAIGRAVVAESDGAQHEDGIDRIAQVERAGQRAVLGRREIVEHSPDVLCHRRCLLLLALDGDRVALASHLDEERAVARSTHGAHREGVHVVELEEHTHRIRSRPGA